MAERLKTTFWRLMLILPFILTFTHCKADKTSLNIDNNVSPGTEFDLPGSAYEIIDGPKNFVIIDKKLVVSSSLNKISNRKILKYRIDEDDEVHEVVLNIFDQNKGIRFVKDHYSGTIYENQDIGTTVNGLDSLFVRGVTEGSAVNYVINYGNENGLFSLQQPHLNSSSIQIVSNARLDREEVPKYYFNISAKAVVDTFLVETTAAIEIKVLDLDDNLPVASSKNYNISVEIGSKNRYIGRISAYDADGDDLVYKLENEKDKFIIEPITGKIIPIVKISDLKSGDIFKLKAYAQEMKNPVHRSDQINISIRIYDSQELCTISVPPPPSESCDTEKCLVRNKRAMRLTKTLEFKETHGEERGKLVFSLRNNSKEQFKLREDNRWVVVDSNGDVRVNEKWDYEKLTGQKAIDFWVTITEPGKPEIHNQRVIVRILDVNDEPPYFINRPLPMQAVVQLNAPPGRLVYKLQARDRDTDHNIHYFIARNRGVQRFEVDGRSGEVTTKGSDLFLLDKEYVLYVKAEDRNGKINDREFQSTPEKRLSIFGGKRPPQFYMSPYEAIIEESTKKDTDIIAVKAKSFAEREIRYTLRAQGKGAGTFNIDPNDGVVKLAKELDFEDLRQPKTYSLIVTATEDSGGLSTSVELTIKVTDVNDNAPKFELPDYQAHNVPENISPGKSILQVKAVDADEGQNSEIEYSVDIDEFTINDQGDIFSNKRLDADNMSVYVLTVKATDKGSPRMTGTATVRVYPENRNDEPPKFSQDVYTPNVDENAGPNTLVTTVVASDKDGDIIKYGFVGGGVTSGQFRIEESTGVIRLHSGAINLDKDKYELNVTATDDGSCCKDGTATLHTSTALVVVFITDVNDNRPIFRNCTSYHPQVPEGSPSGSPVITVRAIDIDKGQNGEVIYSIVRQPNQKSTKFTVHEKTGVVKTNKVYDREGDDGRVVSVTVKATDRGKPPLVGICSFKVEITDINDNPPLFDRQEYKENIKQDTPKGSNILRVSASDEDADNNGAIEYLLGGQNDVEFFSINPDSGWISLRKDLTDQEQYHLKAIAKDKGDSSLTARVDVVINVVDRDNKPPMWEQSEYGPVRIKENISVGEKVISIRARSGVEGNPTVYYTLMKGSTAQTNKYDTFYLKTPQNNAGSNYADILVNYPLDYEMVPQYNLTVRVTDNLLQLANETTIYIVLEDVNDEIPLFIEHAQETVLEGLPVNTKVTQVQSIDKDGTYPNNKVYYSIEPVDRMDEYFRIDRDTGEIYTKKIFDREEQQAYPVLVKAVDGAPSARPKVSEGQPNSVNKLIRIGIGDKNDNPPYFEQALYQAEVNEDEDIQHTVITITAHDKDESSRIRYEITRGNTGGAFAVKNETGAIYVASPLDYETRKEYRLTLVASDNLNENFTSVVIHVKDVNDLPPVFSQKIYETSILEEDNKNLPKQILKVLANDGDRDRPQNIVYFLTGQGIDEKDKEKSNFAINNATGEIYVLKSLDRDLPKGRSQWRFTVLAEDEGGNGMVNYAEVIVNLKDINDNDPFFPSAIYNGQVTENSTKDLVVMTMTAIDYDDPEEGTNAVLKYTIEQSPMNDDRQRIFKIDRNTGVIKTAVCCLDRETTPEYTIKVVAEDGGSRKGTGTATIKVNDINDMPPEFTKDQWYAEVEETEGDKIPFTPILIVSVNDKDLLETNRFSYKVVNKSVGADRFTMVTNSDGTGSLKVAKPLDFEDRNQMYGFNITIQVSDKGGEINEYDHVDTAKVKIKLRDINDNKPEFDRANIETSISEDADVGVTLATFLAHDADQRGMSRVSYAIDRTSDKKRQFNISQNGDVRIQRKLDREVTPRHQVKILAIDDGTPPKTATATLTVIVLDINDNAPTFLLDYRPVIMENTPARQIVEVLATDKDDRSKSNGPPFTFRLDEHAPKTIRESFKVDHDPKGANGDGMAIVKSLGEFDREYQKEYLVPIIIKDNGKPSLSGTSTLTITIGDVNDNRMQPGSKEIFVYNYKGMVPNTPVGRVFVDDLDDWDLNDKSFFWRSSPHRNFKLDESTGMITMLNGTRGGTYYLEFNVMDRQYNNEVSANVTIIVQEITDEAVMNSGSIRIHGTSAEEFIRIWDAKRKRTFKSKYEIFREIIARLVKTDVKNVDVFTVLSRQERPPITDVRFSAHGSPYYKPSELDGLVALNRDMIQEEVGINMTMIKIDECMYENVDCESSCSNELIVDNYPLMINANRTSLVGVNAYVKAKCVCGAREQDIPKRCRYLPHRNPCLNGGRCMEHIGGIRCDRCRPGFNGPMCELTTRSFNGGGYAWFPSLDQCGDSHLSLMFITSQSSGLILYNGPIAKPEPGEIVIQDFISLELQNGKPLLLMDFGSGTLRLIVNVKVELNDEQWHQIDIFWTKETARMVVDNCVNAERDDSQEPPVFNRDHCESRGTIPPFNEFLNVNGPLQIGGVAHSQLGFNWTYQHTMTRFMGCIKNVIHNSKLYDLAAAGRAVESQQGCPRIDKQCNLHSSNPYCLNGVCVATFSNKKCICNPGWYGARCNEQTQEKKFEHNSFIKYALSFDPDKYVSDIQLRFRTRQDRGELFRASSKHGREYVVLELKNKRLLFRYNLNHLHNTEKRLELPRISVDDGQWHVVQVLRYGSTASIRLDNGGGLRYNELLDYDGQHQLIEVEKQNVIVGGDVQYVGPNLVSVLNDFHKSCMDDIRFEQNYLPMENGSAVAAVVDYRAIEPGCKSTDIDGQCRKLNCSLGQICVDAFMKAECGCVKGFFLNTQKFCVDRNECTYYYNICEEDKICINTNGSYECRCRDDDLDCIGAPVLSKASIIVGVPSIIAVIICIIVFFLIVVLVFVVYNKTRRADHKYGDPDDDVRENIINYDDEGGGEDDMNAYDITPLRIPIDANGTPLNAKPGPEKPMKEPRQRQYPPGTHPDVRDFINDHLDKADNDPNAPPFDDLRNYAYEGGGSTAGSLSSLASGTDDNEQDFDYLNEWGPRFHKLADMYGQGESEED